MSDNPEIQPLESEPEGETRKWPYVVAPIGFVALGALAAILFFVLRDDGEVETTSSSSTASTSTSDPGPEPAPDSEWMYPWTSQAQLDRVMAGSAPEFCDAHSVVAGFVTEVVGYREPDLGEPVEAENDTIEVPLSARGEGGVATEPLTTIVVDNIPVEGADCEPLVVVGAVTDDVAIDMAVYDPEISAVKVEGEGTAFEGTVDTRLVNLDEGAGYEVLAGEFTSAGANGDIQPFAPVQIPVDVAVDVGLVIANPQAAADGAEPPFAARRVDIGSEGQPAEPDGTISPPDTGAGSAPGATIAPPEDAPAAGLPNQANAALGTPVWGLYLTAVDEAYAGYDAPELTQAVLDAFNLGYTTSARNMACDDDAVGAVGLDPNLSWLTVPLYFNSQVDAQTVADQLYSYVGIVQVIVGCLD